MAAPTRKVQLSTQLKDQKQRLDNFEERLLRVEHVQEQQEGYRRLRVEHSEAFKTAWERFERKELEGKDLKAELAQGLAQDIQKSLLP